MCDSMYIQRRVSLERAKALFLEGATIDHVLGVVWNAGYVEGCTDPDEFKQTEFDRRVDEMNRELEAERAEAGL